jgi:hypothetical protein
VSILGDRLFPGSRLELLTGDLVGVTVREPVFDSVLQGDDSSVFFQLLQEDVFSYNDRVSSMVPDHLPEIAR